jgi:hypothetical protein
VDGAMVDVPVFRAAINTLQQSENNEHQQLAANADKMIENE